VIERDLIRDVTQETALCPFCGNDENKYRSLMALKLGGLAHYVKCESCAACGPLSLQYPGPESAIEAWNERRGVLRDMEVES